MKLLLFALLALSTPAAAKTWIVDNGFVPSGDFTTIQAAIDAAADGDTIIVNGGIYQESLLVQGKGVTLHGKGVTLQYVLGSGAPVLRVENLAPDQRVSIEDFNVFHISGEFGPSVVLTDNAGSVRIQNTFVDSYDGHALIASNCAELLLVDSAFQCNSPFLDGFGAPQPSVGISLLNGTVAWGWEVDARGSHGFPLFTPATDLIPGGDAVVVDDSTFFAVNPDWRAGNGSSVDVGGCLHGAPGGAGVRILSTTGGAPQVQVQTGIVQSAGPGAFEPCAPHPGMTPNVAGLTAAYSPLYFGSGRVLLMDGQPDLNGQLDVRLLGLPQDVFVVFAAGQMVSPLPLPGYFGPVWIDPVLASVVRIGSLNVFGSTDFSIDLASAPPFTTQL